MPLLTPHATVRFIHIFGCEDTPTNTGKVLCVVVKIVNHIQDSATNFRMFKMSCEEVGPKCNTFLFHTEVCWLSQRILQLREKSATKQEFFGKIMDYTLILKLAYTADYTQIHWLNFSLQRNMVNTFRD
jgi:hypothetical protein